LKQLQKKNLRAKGYLNQPVKIKIQGEADFLEIPRKALIMLIDIIDDMAQGKSVTIVSSDEVIGTQQAAKLLNVSRPYLVNLLEEGEIPFKKAGTHRRIDLNDLLEYQKRLTQNRKKKLNFLADQAQQLNMGY
jgi:excisionase family DNA binding protein